MYFLVKQSHLTNVKQYCASNMHALIDVEVLQADARHSLIKLSPTQQQQLDVATDASTAMFKAVQQAILDGNLAIDAVDLEQLKGLEQIDLMAFDMDSTLIDIECIDELAKAYGCFEAVSAVTTLAMSGQLDFKASLKTRLALLKDAPIRILDDVLEKVTFNDGVIQLFNYLNQQKISTCLVSGGFTFVADVVQKQLGITHAYAHTLELNASKTHLTGNVIGDVIDAIAKKTLVHALAKNMPHASEQTHQNPVIAAVGDGANDLQMLTSVDIGIAFKAKACLKAHANICLDHTGMDALILIIQHLTSINRYKPI